MFTLTLNFCPMTFLFLSPKISSRFAKGVTFNPSFSRLIRLENWSHIDLMLRGSFKEKKLRISNWKVKSFNRHKFTYCVFE